MKNKKFIKKENTLSKRMKYNPNTIEPRGSKSGIGYLSM